MVALEQLRYSAIPINVVTGFESSQIILTLSNFNKIIILIDEAKRVFLTKVGFCLSYFFVRCQSWTESKISFKFLFHEKLSQGKANSPVCVVLEITKLSSCLFKSELRHKLNNQMGSGGGSVVRAVTSNSRGQRFEDGHRQKFILNIYCQLYWKDENKEKEAGNGPFKNTITKLISFSVIRCWNKK